MKIYLDNNLGVTNVEQEELTQDTIGYNILKVYIPNAVLTPYDTFTCYYGALLQNGRKVGWFAMEARTSTDADYEANYTLYKATLEQCVVSVEGKVYIGCQILLGNSGNATLIKKNTAVVQFNVRKSVAINNDILVLDTDQTTTDVLESYKNLLENALTTYATKATTYTKTEVNSALALKADKSDTYTKSEVYTKTETNALLDTKADKSTTYTKTQVDSALALKADKATTYNKDEVDTKDLNLAGQIAGNKVELQNEINSTNNNVITTIARVGALETDVADLKSVQNVVDVVATKSALNSYDTTKLDANDKVQVIADESHDGSSTIYNWNGSAWQYVGAFGGNSYTKTETNTLLSDKADKSDTYTRAVIDSMVLILSTDKADKSTTYTKTEIDGKFEEVGQAFEIVDNEVLKKADKTELNNAINDLRWELGSHTLDVESDTDTSFSKSVPSGAIGCQINKVGGMSYKVNQLVKNGNFADTSNWNAASSINITASNNILTGTYNTNFEAYAEEVKQPITITAGHKFLVSVNLKSLTMSSFYIRTTSGILGQTSSIGLYSNIVTAQNNGDYIGFGGYGNVEQGTGYSISDLNIFDLTADFGSGNEPSTVEACASAYLPRGIDIYSYTPQQSTIRDTAPTSIKSVGSNNTTIDTLTIPSAIQNLTGYGWGVNSTCYNYIDFERKVFVQKVGRVDLGSLNYVRQYNAPAQIYRFAVPFSQGKIPSTGRNINILSAPYHTNADTSVNKDLLIFIASNRILYVYNNAYTDANTFKEAMNGVYLYYELATPIETDISAYLTTDTLDVEPLGTLEFTNTYSQYVPSDIDYLIEEVKA